MSTELPTDPRAIKKMEKDNALKELSSIENSEAKASKAVTKAEKNLRKMEDRDYDTIKTLQKATHSHDQAVTDLHSAQSDLQVKRQQAQRLGQGVDELRKRADQLYKEKQAHDQERSSKLAKLHAQPPPTDQDIGASTTGDH
ncbi:hypothetical protein BDN67DRAFT_1064918 [Paxillus ammoniavirescens]|nr:hypothetical protein BDN67DRAFT_1064918 [Paxillus ammoniavirescens]